MDFLFGQSRKLIKTIGWPLYWAGYVLLVDDPQREEFDWLLTDYKDPYHYCDRAQRRTYAELAKSMSPQKHGGVPNGKIF